jgi:hypothetical protein
MVRTFSPRPEVWYQSGPTHLETYPGFHNSQYWPVTQPLDWKTKTPARLLLTRIFLPTPHTLKRILAIRPNSPPIKIRVHSRHSAKKIIRGEKTLHLSPSTLNPKHPKPLQM